MLPRCRADGIAVLCYSSLQQGLLSGKYSSAAEVPDGMRRTRLYGPASWSAKQCRHGDAELGAAAEAAIFQLPDGVLGRLRQLCAGAGCGVAETALAWLLSRGGVGVVLAGASTPAQAARNARLPAVPAELLRQVTEATEALKELQGPILDQYARESRIH